MDDNTIVWIMCKCYVWPTYAWSISFPLDKQGSCKRCDEPARLLYPDDYKTREQAQECFKENYGHYPLPLGPAENNYWPEGYSHGSN